MHDRAWLTQLIWLLQVYQYMFYSFQKGLCIQFRWTHCFFPCSFNIMSSVCLSKRGESCICIHQAQSFSYSWNVVVFIPDELYYFPPEKLCSFSKRWNCSLWNCCGWLMCRLVRITPSYLHHSWSHEKEAALARHQPKSSARSGHHITFPKVQVYVHHQQQQQLAPHTQNPIIWLAN